MKNCKLEKELPNLIPHLVHLAIGAATIMLSCEILKKLHHLRKGLKEIHEGQEEIKEGRREILGHKK